MPPPAANSNREAHWKRFVCLHCLGAFSAAITPSFINLVSRLDNNTTSFITGKVEPGSDMGYMVVGYMLVGYSCAPFWAILADKYGLHRNIWAVCTFLSAAPMAILPFLTTFEELFWVVMGFAFMSVPGAAFLDASTVEMLGEARDAYGKFRLWGAVGFGAGAGLFGVVDKYVGWQYPFYLYGGTAVAQAWLVSTTPDFLGRIKKERAAKEQRTLAMRADRAHAAAAQQKRQAGDEAKQGLLANAGGGVHNYGGTGGEPIPSPGLKEFVRKNSSPQHQHSNANNPSTPPGSRDGREANGAGGGSGNNANRGILQHFPGPHRTPPDSPDMHGSPSDGSLADGSLLSSSLLTDDGRGQAGNVFPGSSAYGGDGDSMSDTSSIRNTTPEMRGGSISPSAHLEGVAEDNTFSGSDDDDDEEEEMVKGCDGKLKKKGTRPCADLFCKSHYLLFMFAVTVMGIGCTSLGAFLQLFLKDIGADNFLIGLSVTAQTIPEVPLFWFSERMLKCMGARVMLAVGMAGFVLRSWLTAAIPDGEPIWILPIQLLNGITFAVTWAASVSLSKEYAPRGLEATSQTFFQLCNSGLGGIGGALLGGYLYDHPLKGVPDALACKEPPCAREMYRFKGVAVGVCCVVYCVLELAPYYVRKWCCRGPPKEATVLYDGMRGGEHHHESITVPPPSNSARRSKGKGNSKRGANGRKDTGGSADVGSFSSVDYTAIVNAGMSGGRSQTPTFHEEDHPNLFNQAGGGYAHVGDADPFQRAGFEHRSVSGGGYTRGVDEGLLPFKSVDNQPYTREMPER